MLGVNKKTEKSLKIRDEKLLMDETYDKFNSADVSTKRALGCSTNVFHSTKRDDLLSGTGDPKETEDYDSFKLTPVSKEVKRITNNFPRVIPKHGSNYSLGSQQNSKHCSSSNDGNSNFSNSQEVTNNQNSTLKGLMKTTTTSETTDNSSAATIIHVMKKPDCPEIKSDSDNILNSSHNKKFHDETNKNRIETAKSSPEFSSNDRSYRSPFAHSDVSREIKEIMSPMSANSNELKTPESGRYVKRLVDHFRPLKNINKNGWISPSQEKINNSSNYYYILFPTLKSFSFYQFY